MGLGSMSLNHTNDRYSTSKKYPQPTTNQARTDSNPVFSSLRRMDSKRRDCASALHSFNEITYQTDEWTKQLLGLKSWVISVNQEQGWNSSICDELKLYLSVAIGFTFLSFIFWWCIICLLFWKDNLFVPFPWWLWVRSKSSSSTSM